MTLADVWPWALFGGVCLFFVGVVVWVIATRSPPQPAVAAAPSPQQLCTTALKSLEEAGYLEAGVVLAKRVGRYKANGFVHELIEGAQEEGPTPAVPPAAANAK